MNTTETNTEAKTETKQATLPLQSARMKFCEGTYEATVLSAVIEPSPNKGTPAIFGQYMVEGLGTIEGALWLTAKAMPSTLKTLRETFDFDGKFATVGDQMKDKKCSIVVRLEEDEQGRTWPRIRFVNPSRHNRQPADSDLLASIQAAAAAADAVVEEEEGAF